MPDAKQTFSEAFEVFRLYWLAHLRSKTTDYAAHKAHEEAYGALERVMHTLAERSEDNGDPVDDRDASEIAKEAFAAADALLSKIAAAVPSATAGETKVLTDAASDLEGVLGTQKQFIK